MEGVLKGFKKQVLQAFGLGKGVYLDSVKKVLICGVGGSALPGDFIKSLFSPLKFEVCVVKDYKVPEFINNDYACFCISYSGNTEETINCYKELTSKKLKIIVITSGGELKKLAEQDKTKLVLVPGGFQPRLALPFLVMPVLNILNNSGLTEYNLGKELSNLNLDYDFQKTAKMIAVKIMDTIPLIYASNRNYFLAEKWKISFNENTKTPAFFNVYPEWNHNELNSFKNNKTKFTALLLTDEEDNQRVKKRYEITSNILQSKKVNVIPVPVLGNNRLNKLLYSLLFADWTSYELAVLYDTDPVRVPVIEELKKELVKE